MLNRVRVCLLCAIAAAAGFAGTAVALEIVRERPQLNASPNDRRQVRARAFQIGGLLSVAEVGGSASRTEEYYMGSPASLSQLVAFSTRVVVGSPVFNRSSLTSDGRSVEMTYDVAVSETIKGSARESVGLVVPGGRLRLSSGNLVNVYVRGFRRPVNGRNYLLFLRPLGGGRYEPAFGPLGIFDVTDREAPVRSSGGWSSSLLATLRRDRVINGGLIDATRRLAAPEAARTP